MYSSVPSSVFVIHPSATLGCLSASNSYMDVHTHTQTQTQTHTHTHTHTYLIADTDAGWSFALSAGCSQLASLNLGQHSTQRNTASVGRLNQPLYRSRLWLPG